jgi:pilus assembly protein Flp/PilA
MTKTLRRFLRDETGATAIEYGLIVAVLSLAVVGGIGKAADAIQYLWGDNNSRLQQALQGTN